MRRLLISAALPFTLLACAPAPADVATTAPPPATETAAEPAALGELVDQVDIPYDSFKLDNGLTVLVHTDRKTPVVGVTTYYRVGSKNEPRGKTGFAHLYEHLFFGGSENVPNFDIPLEGAGSTSTNGSTWYDRTNYVETVPTGALDLALFMESDRMGHLLGAVTQDKLDKQRGVVQNEKRMGDNQPYGLTDYLIGDALFPVGHPYRHSTIGSMADLDAATLTDVRNWYRDNYAPNNVVLALAGDIDVATAKPMVEKWFGNIPSGPEVDRFPAPLVTLDAPKREVVTDQVPVTRIYKVWSGPGLNDPDTAALSAGMSVLGGLASSRLDNVLVRDEQLAVSVSAYALPFEETAFLQVQMDVKPGVDAAAAEKRLDEVIARLVQEGPTSDELLRAATRSVSAQIGALELVGGMSGKGATLAEGLLYSGDPAHYKKDLEATAQLTPAAVRAAMQQWLGNRPSYTLVVQPGERTLDGAELGGWGDEGEVAPPPPDPKTPVPPVAQGPERAFPPVAPVAELTFPKVEHATLSNGIPVTLARRTAIPKVSMMLNFDAGFAADGSANAGTQSLMMDLLEEGTTSRSAVEIAEEQERLGASINTSTGLDRSNVSMTALTANLAPSLALMADIARNPAFAADDVARVKDQRLAAIQQAQATPESIAQRALRPLIYGTDHPYGSVGASGKSAVIEALTPAQIRTVHDTWLRPDLARIAVVGDVTMAELMPQLEQAFGDWKVPAMPKPSKNLSVDIPESRQRLVVIDRPNSPQSMIMLAHTLPLEGTTEGMESLDLAHQVIGGGFLSRLNMDLREDKGWTYYAYTSLSSSEGPLMFTAYSPVQTDKTGDAIKAMIADMRAFPADKGVDEVELQRVTDGNVRGLPNSFQTNGQVLGGIIENQTLGRPDDYYARLPTIYEAIDAQAIDASAAKYLQPDDMTIVVVGDRKEIDSQLAGLGIPIEYRDASEF